MSDQPQPDTPAASGDETAPQISKPAVALFVGLAVFGFGVAAWLWNSYKTLPPAPELKHIAVVNDQRELWGPQNPSDTWLVVNFWATWCAPCLAELPLLEAFSQATDPDKARVVGFTRLYQTPPGEDPTQEVRYITAFLQEQGVTFPSLINDDEFTHFAYGVENLPTTILISPQGQIVDMGVGILETTRILDQIDAMLRKP